MNEFLENLEEELSGLSEDYSRFVAPKGITFEKLERWFPPRSISEVSFCLEKLNKIGLSSTNKKFILVALSECLRLISFQRNNEFKLYRIPEEKRDLHNVPLYSLLENRIHRNFDGVKEFMKRVSSSTKKNVYAFNTVDEHGREYIGSPDLVVTSPPYGDSATTVAYAQFSWMTNVWLGFDSRSPGALDRDLMGGRRTEITEFGFKPMDDAIAKILIEDVKRASEVMDFYSEYYQSIENVAKVVSKNGYVCYVVGNRRVKGVQLPTDQFTAWAFEKNGFEYICTHIREIPNKRMPSRNSPTNVSGKTASTMGHEYIVVLKKVEADP